MRENGSRWRSISGLPGAVHPVAIEYQSSESTFSAQVDISDGEGYISADGRNWSGTEEAQNSNCVSEGIHIRRTAITAGLRQERGRQSEITQDCIRNYQ